MSVFHCGICIAIAGFPVFRRRHVVIEGRAEEFSPVDFLFAGLEVELDIRGVSQFKVTLLGLIFLGVLPALSVRPEGMTCLEVLGLDFLLEHRQLLQLL